ncbi:hypothetical protein Tco_0261756 [Tanacetum coccineum]
MEDEIFFNQSMYIKEMLKKFGLEDSKPTKTPMSTEIKLTMDDESDFVDSTKYRVIMEYLVKISKKARILELKRRNMKKLILTSYTSFPSRKIWRICACTSQKTTKEQDPIRPRERYIDEYWWRIYESGNLEVLES